MKHIVKGTEPIEFTDWKALANDNWEPTYGKLSGAEKLAVKNTLIDEQGGICCYCERSLVDIDSHIEHFRPQNLPDVDPLDFGNMLCSCQDQLKKGDPCLCGVRKEDWFDENLLISPLDPSCEEAFAYSADGGIRETNSNKNAAKKTIEKLGLDLDEQCSRRASAIEPFLDEFLTHEELSIFVVGYLTKNPEGFFQPFFTTIKYLFRNLLPEPL